MRMLLGMLLFANWVFTALICRQLFLLRSGWLVSISAYMIIYSMHYNLGMFAMCAHMTHTYQT